MTRLVKKTVLSFLSLSSHLLAVEGEDDDHEILLDLRHYSLLQHLPPLVAGNVKLKANMNEEQQNYTRSSSQSDLRFLSAGRF